MNRTPDDIERLKKLGQERDIFYFKQFQVKDDRSTMKVGTDAVLLGIAADVDNGDNILEVGTGCGVVSLILAQRAEVMIDALEIDRDSVRQARDNVRLSPWAERIQVIHAPLQEFLRDCSSSYDLIISNPPFFSRSFKSSIEKRNLSRHDDSLSFEELLEASRQLLGARGNLWVILPVREGEHFRQKAGITGFYPQHFTHIIPKEGKSPNRAIMAFARQKTGNIVEEHLTLRDARNEFSEEYKAFARDYYIDF